MEKSKRWQCQLYEDQQFRIGGKVKIYIGNVVRGFFLGDFVVLGEI
ncbi:hypothetical protein [Bacillus cereus]